MHRAVRPGWWLPVGGVLVVGTVLAAQGSAPGDGSMRELVAEVKALRLAVERTSTLTARSQALLGRVQLQENRLADLGRRVDDARQRVRTAAAQETQLASQLAAEAARVLDLPAGSEERVHVDLVLKQLRPRLKAAQDELAQLRADEQAVLGALSEEQGRWRDYNARLEAIEQEFGRPDARRP